MGSGGSSVGQNRFRLRERRERRERKKRQGRKGKGIGGKAWSGVVPGAGVRSVVTRENTLVATVVKLRISLSPPPSPTFNESINEVNQKKGVKER